MEMREGGKRKRGRGRGEGGRGRGDDGVKMLCWGKGIIERIR